MSDFQQYQAAFTGHIRDPKAMERPAGAVARRMKIYTEIVFNNMEATLAACFPVTKKLLRPRRWTRLVRAFLAGHRCATPLFRQIPEEFLRWLESGPDSIADLPFFLGSLAHYEWVELAVALADVEVEASETLGDLLRGRPVLAASLMLLEYPCAVHHLSPRYQPTAPDAEPTRLLVFRDAADTVRFIEVNAVTARLVQLLQASQPSGQAVLDQVALELQHPDPVAVRTFGLALLEDLRQQGVILGTAM